MHFCADGIPSKEKSQDHFTFASSSSSSLAPGNVHENISVSKHSAVLATVLKVVHIWLLVAESQRIGSSVSSV